MLAARNKSQLSVILILSMLVVMVVFIVIILVINSERQGFEVDIGSFEPVRDEILNCLEDKFEYAIYKAGMQGGFISESEGGREFFLSESFLSSGDFRVPFALSEEVYYNESFPFDCPNPYGSSTQPFNHIYESPPASCQKHYLFNTKLEYRPPLRNLRANRTVQNIQHYLNGQYGVIQCLPRLTSDLVSEDFEVLSVSEPWAGVFLSETGMLARLDYEITLRRKGTGETKILSDFESFIRLRLYDVLDFLDQQLFLDASFADFEPGSSSEGIEGMTVRVIRNPDPSNHPGADIISVEDSNNFVRGEEYVFQVARRNRAPIPHALPKVTLSDGTVAYGVVNISVYEHSSIQEIREAFDFFYNLPACDDDSLRKHVRTLFYKTGIINATDPDSHHLTYADNIDNSDCNYWEMPFKFTFKDAFGKETVIEIIDLIIN
ncbi:MAG TPA: hypothetical protein ENN46_02345 [Candidatus Woesearchaeota archaeon]|nr:hypothetical protein [Candidatus Woesearchaeota archaeon]